MNTRLGFVSNSSSSSFVLDKTRCTPSQLDAIRNHIEFADKHFFGFYTEPHNSWDIAEKEHDMRGFTWMDNFDMQEFLEKIGVPDDAVDFDGENW